MIYQIFKKNTDKLQGSLYCDIPTSGWVDPSVYKKCSFPMNFSKHKTSALTKIDGENAHNCSRVSGLAQELRQQGYRTQTSADNCKQSGHTTLYCGPPGPRPLSSVPFRTIHAAGLQKGGGSQSVLLFFFLNIKII